MSVPKVFPVLLVDHEALKSFLFSVAVAIAHDRATSISESNELGIAVPSPANGRPVNVGMVYKSADTDWDPQRTKTTALLLYGKYLEIALRNLSEGAPSFYSFYSRLNRLRNEARASLRAKYDEIARQNRQSDDLAWLGASIADQARSVGTVVMATAGCFVAVTGAPAAGSAAGVFLVFKVGMAIADNGISWKNAKAVVIGNPTAGEASIGEGTQKLIDGAIEKGRTSLQGNYDQAKTWSTYLEENVRQRTAELARMRRGGWEKVSPQQYRDAWRAREHVQDMARTAGKDTLRAGGSVARFSFLAGKVLPVVAWAGDLVSEYSRSQTVQDEINQNR